MSKAESIYEWFQDHFETFECYPMDWIDYADNIMYFMSLTD